MFEEYKEEQDYINDFISGKIDPKELLVYYDKNERLRRYIEIKNIEARKISSFWNKISKIESSVFFSKVRNGIDVYLDADIYNYLFRLFSSFDNDIVASTRWTEKSRLLINGIPDYLDGNLDIIKYINESIVSNISMDLSETKKIKTLKEEIKKAFYIEGNKYPHWIQSSEWPLSKTGKPTKYLRTENKYGGEVKAYIFLDVDTNEEIIVEQCY